VFHLKTFFCILHTSTRATAFGTRKSVVESALAKILFEQGIELDVSTSTSTHELFLKVKKEKHVSQKVRESSG